MRCNTSAGGMKVGPRARPELHFERVWNSKKEKKKGGRNIVKILPALVCFSPMYLQYLELGCIVGDVTRVISYPAFLFIMTSPFKKPHFSVLIFFINSYYLTCIVLYIGLFSNYATKTQFLGWNLFTIEVQCLEYLA